jgi:hypothetical protein
MKVAKSVMPTKRSEWVVNLQIVRLKIRGHSQPIPPDHGAHARISCVALYKSSEKHLLEYGDEMDVLCFLRTSPFFTNEPRLCLLGMGMVRHVVELAWKRISALQLSFSALTGC